MQPGQPISSGWTCPSCSLRSYQQSHDSFQRHWIDLHATELAEKQRLPEPEYNAWWETLCVEAFGSPPARQPQQIQQQQQQQNQLPPSPGRRQPVHQNSFGTKFQQLSIQHVTTNHDQVQSHPGHVDSPQPSQAYEDISNVAQPSRPNSSLKNPRIQTGNRQSPGARNKQLRAGHGNSPLEPANFAFYTSQNRPTSREVEAADDPMREERRKGQSNTSSQPASPAASAASAATREPSAAQRHRGLILQPNSQGISQQQLATEVRTIYNGLTALETRCIKFDKDQAIAAEKSPIPANTWRALISIHRALLNDHHDFFLASQHPSAAPPLHRLAVKYNMPARMWKHGIHSFLELLRHQLPHGSLEFMIGFIYLAYQMMSLLLETVPSFEDTWIECLGDLSRYRMAVEEEDPKDRETWGNVAKYWYCKAADRMPNTGRLYHHLAILARPRHLNQCFLYSKSLVAVHPFLSARESVTTLFDPILRDGASYIAETDVQFITCIANLFYRRYDKVEEPMIKFHQLLGPHIQKMETRWREAGIHVAGSTIGALFDFGNKSSFVRIFEIGNYVTTELNIVKEAEVLQNPFVTDADAEKSFEIARALFFKTFWMVVNQPLNENVRAYLHVVLIFILSLVSFHQSPHIPAEMQTRLLEFLRRVPWDNICTLLNAIADTTQTRRHETTDFLRSERGDPGPLPEDHAVRGFLFTQTFYPSDWFQGTDFDDERTVEHMSTMSRRAERMLWVGYKLAKYGCLMYSVNSRSFNTNVNSPCVSSADAQLLAQKNTALVSNNITGQTYSTLVTDHMEEVLPTNASQKDIRTVSNQEPLPLHKSTTALVFSLDVLLNHLRLCQQMINDNWTVIISTIIWHKLKAISKDQKDEKSSAAAAETIQTIKQVVKSHPQVKLIEPRGWDVTAQFMKNEKAQVFEGTQEEYFGLLIECTNKAAGFLQNPSQTSQGSQCKSSALVTNDTALQAAARNSNVYSVSPEALELTFIQNEASAMV